MTGSDKLDCRFDEAEQDDEVPWIQLSTLIEIVRQLERLNNNLERQVEDGRVPAKRD